MTALDGGLVCFAGQDWRTHGRAHADFQLCTELARTGTKTLVVNSIGMRMPTPGSTSHFAHRIARKARSTLDAYRRPLSDVPDLALLSPLIVPAYGSERGRRINTSLVARQVGRAMDRQDLDSPACIVTVPTALDVALELDLRPIVYYRADAHSESEDIDRDLILEFEERLFEVSDLVLYSSNDLLECEHHRHRGRVQFFDHGVDANHFHPDRGDVIPPELASIPGPLVGYFGSVEAKKVDMRLIARVATELPDVSLVLVGRAGSDVSCLERLPNVHLLGWRDHDELPEIARWFDLALLPRPGDAWNSASNPIKLKEYLALGLPVVSTPLPSASRYHPHVVETPDASAFVAAVARLTTEGAPGTAAERRSLVADETWAARASEFVQLLTG